MILHFKIHRCGHICLLSIAMWFIISIMTNDKAWTDMNVIIRKIDNGREITLKSAETFCIELEALGGAGYTWEFNKLDGNYFELVKEETTVLSKEGYTGGPLLTTWQLKAKDKEGKTEIRLLCYRPWEGRSKAIDTFRVKIKIVK